MPIPPLPCILARAITVSPRLGLFIVLSLPWLPPGTTAAAPDSLRAAAPELTETEAVGRIATEAMTNSQVMRILNAITDLNGPRLTWSPQFMSAARWIIDQERSWNLDNAHLESWTPLGRGWALRHYSLGAMAPYAFPVISYPSAWSPSTPGKVTGGVVLFDGTTDSALAAARGTLKGKFVLLSAPRVVSPHFEPLASRETDSSLLVLANAVLPPPVVRGTPTAGSRERETRTSHKLQMCMDEGALALLSISKGDGGNVFVQAAAVPHPAGTSPGPHPYDPAGHDILPQAMVGAEHYNRIVRLLRAGKRVQLAMDLAVDFSAADSGYNVLADIPGTDLRNQVVMIGGHLDSWHGGTGATDNGAGVACCLEAARILTTLGLKPRRTIRVAFWGGEEQGFLGSKAYVRRHLGFKETGDSSNTLVLSPEAQNLSLYLNNDNGTGRVRGMYMEGNEAVRPIFRAWLDPFSTTGAGTLTIRSTGSTDHLVFDEIGIPAFQFIQDDIEYETRTWHSTMDVADRAVEDDLKQTAMIIAAFAYRAAMRDEPIPRKVLEGVRIEVRDFSGSENRSSHVKE